MLSLEKVYIEMELRMFLKWVEVSIGDVVMFGGVSWVIEFKYDGFVVSVMYECGWLVWVVICGDGSEGDDVMVNVWMIGMLLEVLCGIVWLEWVELCGEVFVSFLEFEWVNVECEVVGEVLFVNLWVLVVGSLKLSEFYEVCGCGLSVVFYGWGEVWLESVWLEM